MGEPDSDNIQRYEKQNTITVPQLRYINASTSINISGKEIVYNNTQASNEFGQNNWDARFSIRYSNIKSLKIDNNKEE